MNPQTVAVVDNDPRMLKAIERLLMASGFAVSPFSSAEQFLEGCEPFQFGCLLLDIHLDGMSGLELRRELGRIGSTLPVVLMTAFDTASTREEAATVGCVAFLPKPFGSSALINAIESALAKSLH